MSVAGKAAEKSPGTGVAVGAGVIFGNSAAGVGELCRAGVDVVFA